MAAFEAFYAANAAYLWLVAALMVLLLFVLVLRLTARIGGVGAQHRVGQSSGSDLRLSEFLDDHGSRIDELADRTRRLEAQCASLDVRLEGAVQRVGVIRFNPFGDTGGDQSFALALIDGRGDGVVISSLYGRSESRVFAKSLAAGESKYSLTEEEREAITVATHRPPVPT